jgi:hypothetical protein
MAEGAGLFTLAANYVLKLQPIGFQDTVYVSPAAPQFMGRYCHAAMLSQAAKNIYDWHVEPFTS